MKIKILILLAVLGYFSKKEIKQTSIEPVRYIPVLVRFGQSNIGVGNANHIDSLTITEYDYTDNDTVQHWDTLTNVFKNLNITGAVGTQVVLGLELARYFDSINVSNGFISDPICYDIEYAQGGIPLILSETEPSFNKYDTAGDGLLYKMLDEYVPAITYIKTNHLDDSLVLIIEYHQGEDDVANYSPDGPLNYFVNQSEMFDTLSYYPYLNYCYKVIPLIDNAYSKTFEYWDTLIDRQYQYTSFDSTALSIVTEDLDWGANFHLTADGQFQKGLREFDTLKLRYFKNTFE